MSDLFHLTSWLPETEKDREEGVQRYHGYIEEINSGVLRHSGVIIFHKTHFIFYEIPEDSK
jgi:hypothetical protein